MPNRRKFRKEQNFSGLTADAFGLHEDIHRLSPDKIEDFRQPEGQITQKRNLGLVQKAVIYDMDGVIIDSEPLWREAEKWAFAQGGVIMSDEMCMFTKGWRTNEVVEYWKLKFPEISLSASELEELIITGVSKLIRERGKAMDGLVESLELFQKMDYKIGLASSSPMKLIRDVIETLKIENYFYAVHSAEKEKFGKPHPAVFLNCAESLEVHPTNCIVIEDSVHGMVAAKAARMKCILIPEEKKNAKPQFGLADVQIDSLNEIDKRMMDLFFS